MSTDSGYYLKKSSSCPLRSELSKHDTLGTLRSRDPPQADIEAKKDPSLVAPGDGDKSNTPEAGEYTLKVIHNHIDNNSKSQPKHLLQQENAGARTASTRISTGSNIIASRIIHCPQLLIITFCLMTGEERR